MRRLIVCDVLPGDRQPVLGIVHQPVLAMNVMRAPHCGETERGTR